MYEVSKFAADFVVEAASKEADRLEMVARSKEMGGPRHEKARKEIRSKAHDLRCVIAGINTGEGVTRATAVERDPVYSVIVEDGTLAETVTAKRNATGKPTEIHRLASGQVELRSSTPLREVLEMLQNGESK